MTPVADQVKVTLSLYGGKLMPATLSDIVASHPGCEDQHDVNRTINTMMALNLLRLDGPYITLVSPQRDADISAYLAAADTYRAQMEYRKTWRGKVGAWMANLFGKIWGGIFLITAVSFFALGLSL